MASLRKYEGSIKEMFDFFSPAGLAQQTIQIDENKEEFLRLLNEEFGGNGLYFELQEKEFEFNGLMPSLAIPDINLKFIGREEKIGFLEPRTKTLVHVCERNIEKIQEQMIQLKRVILKIQNEVKELDEQISRKKWNLFVLFFKKRSIIRLEVESRRMLSEIEEIKFRLLSRQSELNFESDIRSNVIELIKQMEGFGVKGQAV